MPLNTSPNWGDLPLTLPLDEVAPIPPAKMGPLVVPGADQASDNNASTVKLPLPPEATATEHAQFPGASLPLIVLDGPMVSAAITAVAPSLTIADGTTHLSPPAPWQVQAGASMTLASEATEQLSGGLPTFASITQGTLWQTMARFAMASYDDTVLANNTRANLLASGQWQAAALDLQASGVASNGDAYTYVGGYYKNVTFGADWGSAFVAQCGDTLVISFTGSDDLVDWVIDFTDMDVARIAFNPMFSAIDAFLTGSGSDISQVYVTGHSLGGGLAQSYMLGHADTAALSYKSITFAAPGFNEGVIWNAMAIGLAGAIVLDATGTPYDPRVIHIEASTDPVADVLLKTGRTVHVYNSEDEPPIYNLFHHSMGRYLSIAEFLDQDSALSSQIDVPRSGTKILVPIRGSADLGWSIGQGNDDVGDPYVLHDFDVVMGGIGNDTLGGADFGDASGANRMFRGTGNDTYLVDAVGDSIDEATGAGIDTARSVISFTLSDQVENLVLLESLVGRVFDPQIDGTGNGLANQITGNDASNVLSGLAGNDTLTAGLGDDVLHGGADNDTLIARGGGDQLNGGSGSDTYDLMRVDYDFGTSSNTPRYTLQDESGTADLLIVRDNFKANLDGIDDLRFRAVGADLWIDLDVTRTLDVDDDEGRFVILGQGTAGQAIESLRLFDELGVAIGNSFSLTSAYSALAATGTSNWFRLQGAAPGANGLGLTVVAGSGVEDGSGSTFVDGSSLAINAGQTYTLTGQIADIGHTTVHTIVPAQRGALLLDFDANSDGEGGQYQVEVADASGRVLESFSTYTWSNNTFQVGVASASAHTVRLTNIGDAQALLLDPNNGKYTLYVKQDDTRYDYESEGNNSRADADALVLGRTSQGQLSTFNGDVDWYRVTPAQAGALAITLDGRYGTGVYPNLVLQVTDVNGVALETFRYLGTENERTYHVGVANTTGNYIKVWHDNADGALNTQLYTLAVSQAATSRDYESEGNNSLATADAVTLGRVTEGQLSYTGDADWFKVTPAQAGALEIRLDGAYGNGVYPNLTLQATDASGTVLETFRYLGTEHERVYHLGVASTAAHYVKVLHDLADGAQNGEWYTLQISQANTAYDYESEGNNSLASADVLRLGRLTEGQLLRAGDVDFFKVAPSQAGALEIVLDGDYDGGLTPNLSVQVSNAAGTVLETFQYLGTVNQMVFHVGVASTAVHNIQVFHDSANGAQNTAWYDLTVSQADTSQDYESEPNSTLAGADVLVAGRWTEGQLSSAADVDWYRLNPAQPGLLEVTIDGSYGYGSVASNHTLQVTDAAGVVQQTFRYLNSVNQQTFSVNLDSSATRYIKVLHEADLGAANTALYNLNATVTNLSPVLAAAMADRSTNEDQPWAYTLPAGTFTDPGDLLTYTASLAGGGALPAWISFDSSTRSFSGTPGNAQIGAVDISVTARDGAGASAIDTFRLTVANVNDAPRLAVALADAAVNEDAAFSWTVPAASFADDDAGDSLTYTASQVGSATLPAWLSFNTSTRSFSGTPGNADVGSVDIRLTARDPSGATQFDDFRLTVVNTRDAPITAAASVTVVEDTVLTFTRAHIPFQDVDAGDALQALRIHSLPAAGMLKLNGVAITALTDVSAADLAAGRLSYTPAANGTASASFNFSVSDGGGFSAPAAMTVLISAVNDAPLLVAPLLDQVGFTGRLFQYSVPNGAFADPELDALSFEAGLAGGAPLPAWLQFDNQTRLFSGTPGADAAGAWDVQVTARDLFGAARSDAFTIRVDAEHAATVAGATPASVGTAIHSVVDSAGDKDWFRVQLNAGVAYTISLDGVAAGSVAALADSYLRLLDASGTELDHNDDVVTGDLDSQLVFTPTVAGPYLVEAGGYSTYAGAYRLLVSAANANLVVGDAGANPLFGTAGNDTLDGLAGADTLTGGDGSDLYIVDNPGDQVVETNAKPASGGIDTVHSSLASHSLAPNVENGLVLGTAAGNLVGNGLNNQLTGNAGANRLDGGAGTDTLAGGAGDDQYIVDATGDVVQEAAGGGTDEVLGSVAHSLGTEVEHLTLTGSAALAGTGNALANRITGNGGHNLLSGAAGNDTLVGGDGNDTLIGGSGGDVMTGGAGDDVYTFDSGADVIVEAAGGGTDTVRIFGSHTMAANVENLEVATTANVAVTGNGLDNRLHEGSGSNLVNGGLGNDTVDYSAAASAISANLWLGAAQATGGSGSDTLSNIENLVGSAFNDSLTGNAAANRLEGGNGHDTLNGSSGADTLVGGLGDDVYYFDNAGDRMLEDAAGGTDEVRVLGSHTMADHIENLRILATGAVAVAGNGLDNLLVAGSGDNQFYGGLGNDTVSYTSAGAGVTVSLATGAFQATGGSGTDLLSSIEHLAGSAFNDSLAGSTGANRLDGGDGHDTLNGSSGADTMVGGGGDDVYYFDNGGDVITEAAGAGTDEVRILGSHVMAANVENLRVVSAGTVAGFGNGLNNLMLGAAGANTLNGGAGNDTLVGGAGNDSLAGSTGADVFVLDSLVGSDTITDFASGLDKLRINPAGIAVGNGDAVVNGATTVAGPGGFATSAEWVLVAGNIAGAITTASAATAIGSATSAYAVGAKALFAVDNGADSALFLFTAADAQAGVTSAELTLLASLTGTPGLASSDLLFGA